MGFGAPPGKVANWVVMVPPGTSNTALQLFRICGVSAAVAGEGGQSMPVPGDRPMPLGPLDGLLAGAAGPGTAESPGNPPASAAFAFEGPGENAPPRATHPPRRPRVFGRPHPPPPRNPHAPQTPRL